MSPLPRPLLAGLCIAAALIVTLPKSTTSPRANAPALRPAVAVARGLVGSPHAAANAVMRPAASKVARFASEEGAEREASLTRGYDPDAGTPVSKPNARQLAQPFTTTVVGTGDQIVNTFTSVSIQSETAIASNTAGTVLVAGFNDASGFTQTPTSLSGVAHSTDGGLTWSQVLEGPAGEGTLPCPAGGSVYGDPDIAYDPVGNRFIYSSIYIRPTDGLQGMCLHVSNATGTGWAGPLEVTPAFITGHSADKEFIDVNATTGRILIVWNDFASTGGVKVLSSYSDNGGTTWSSAVALVSYPVGSTSGPQGPIPRWLPGNTNATSTAYVAWTVVTGTSASIVYSRSIDGGASWSAPVALGSSFPVTDQVVGVDRAHNMPSMAIDRVSGQVYVAYEATNAGGTGDIALVVGTGTTFGAPQLIDSNPGADRAQWYPCVTVDQTTHRVHAMWYDQDIATNGGDLTEVMHTFSDNGGATWSRPVPLMDRPFHASYGDGTTDPNLGDYIHGIAVNGVLHTLAGTTAKTMHFDDGQPSAEMFSTDVSHDRLPQGPGTGFNLLARSSYAAGTLPEWVAIADVTGDTKPDVIVANEGGTVSVMRGTGGGAFPTHTDIPVGPGTYVAIPVDLNGDGKQDIATANTGDGTVSVLLGTGGGSFAPRVDYLSGNNTTCVAAGDLNGDAKPDLVSANYNDNTLTVRLNTGAGAFGAPMTFATGTNPNWVALGDLNGDGKLDAVVANAGAGSISVLLGNGSGGFGAKTDFTVGTTPLTLALGNLNNDAALDVVTANFGDNTVTVRLGNGSGGFFSGALFSTAPGPVTVAAGDVDLDGKTDIVTANAGGSSPVSVLRGDGTGAFGAPSNFPANGDAYGVAIGDVNEDGARDLVTANVNNTISVLLGKGSNALGYQPVSLRLGSTSVTDACASGGNGSIDPGETARLTFGLTNYVSNPVCSPVTFTNVHARVTTTTPGVSVITYDLPYADIAPLATVANATPFRLTLDPSFVPGTDVDLLLTVTSDQGTTQIATTLATGTPGAPTVLINENFESAVVPALPASWTSNVGGGTNVAWTTSTSIPGGGVGSKAAFHSETAAAKWMRLWSPQVVVPTPAPGTQGYVALDFDVAYSLEDQPGYPVQAYDGLCVRITDSTTGFTTRSLFADAFATSITTGTSDGYPKRLPRANITGYFPENSVWSGNSSGFRHVSMKFPAAGMTGHTVQLRFEYTQDAAGICTDNGYPAPCGVAIDNVVLQYVPITSAPCTPLSVEPGAPIAFDLRARSNPVRVGELAAQFVLPSTAPAELELLDVTGRVLERRDVGSLGAGVHAVSLAGSRAVAPGMYFMRLRQSDRERVVRVTVLQ